MKDESRGRSQEQKNKNMKTITVEELKSKLDSKADIQVIDIREDWEVEAASFGAEHIPMGEVPNHLDKIARDKPVIIHCRSGSRSARMIEFLTAQFQFDNLINLEGGIKAWAEKIDNNLKVE